MPTWVRKAFDVVTSRWFVKGAFLAFFVYACNRLLAFERWAHQGGRAVHRPESVGGLLPVGHFTSFFAWLKGGGWDHILPAGLVIILGALATSFIFRRGFCGWICPVGTVWEASWAVGRRLTGRRRGLPKALDIPGRVVRYVLTALIVGFLMMQSVAWAVEFRSEDYMAIADIKMLHLMLAPTYLLIVALVVVVSMLAGPIWCRYLCPLGGIYSLLGFLSPLGIVRDEASCTHCRKCTKACHAYLEPEKTLAVRSVECDGCMECVKACPVDGCLSAKAAGRVRISPQVWALLVVALWLGIWGIAKVTGNWDTGKPTSGFVRVIRSGLIESKTPGF